MEMLVSEIIRLRERKKEILYCGVRHRGKPLLEHWFEEADPAAPLPVFSVSKTVTALLVGKALQQGYIRCLDVPVRELLFRYGEQIPKDLTLTHLLTMTAGYDWPETATFGRPDGVFKQFLDAEDAARFVLERPRSAAPGEHYSYSSGLSHLMMVILEQATGMNPAEYARKELWQPLEVSDEQWGWRCDSRGIPYGGHGLSLTAHGMERLGELMLGMGSIDGFEIVPKPYMRAMATIQVAQTRGYEGYGFQTWIGQVEGNRFYGAFGHGGQRIYAFPELQLQVVFLGRKVLPEFGIHERLIRKGILPEIAE